MRRNTMLPVMIFIVAVALFSPVHAWDIDGTCEGIITTLHNFTFDSQESFNNEYTTNFGGTATGSFTVSEGKLNVVCSGNDIVSWCQFYNSTVSFPIADITRIGLDFTLTGYEDVVPNDNADIFINLVYDNATEDYSYQSYNYFSLQRYFYPYFIDVELTKNIFLNTNCERFNLTTGEYIDSVSCPDYAVFNFLDVQVYENADSNMNGWEINLTFDNLFIGDDENSWNSPDCALIVPNISYLYDNSGYYTDNFIKINATTKFSEGTSEYTVWAQLRGIGSYLGDGNMAFYLFDDTSELGIFTWGDAYTYSEALSNTTNTDSFSRKLVEFTGYYFDDGTGKPRYSIYDDHYCPYDMYMELYDAQEIGEFEGEIPIYGFDSIIGSKPIIPTTGRNSRFKILVNGIYSDIDRYYSRLNETHLIRYSFPTNTTNLYEIDDDFKHTTTNTTLYVIFLEYDGGYIPYVPVITEERLSFNLDFPFYIIAEGILINQTYNIACEGEEFTDYGIFTELRNINVIGDGICGTLESNNPYSWNYDESCNPYGLTGWSIVQQSKAMVGVLGVVVILSISFFLLYGTETLLSKITLAIIGIFVAVMILTFISGI